MARRTKKGDATIGILVAIVGIPLFVLAKLHESIGAAGVVTILIFPIAGYIWFSSNRRKARRAALMEKYQDSDVVERIMSSSIWQGQSAEQLTESIGAPVAVDDQVLKTKKKEVWKYHPQGGNRYNLRITLEDDFVVGWDKKS